MKRASFNGKKIIIGITGGIAAYKTCLLVREIRRMGGEVKVVMTPAATEFITPLTLSALSQNEVIVNIFPDQKNGCSATTWHIDLALWADLMIIAPATVNTVAKMAYGFSDNAVTTLVSALRCPLVIAPAADVDMYQNKINEENLAKLEGMGHLIIPAEEGELASGLSGMGRLPEIEKILDAAEVVLCGYRRDLKGKKILITAGPTFEDIDPVRFIGNRSSGKMGYALAKAAYLRGGEVTIISGPSNEKCYPEVKCIKVRSGEEMYTKIMEEKGENEYLIMAAAVADFRPEKFEEKKIKKEKNLTEIKVSPARDILLSLKGEKLVKVGFALETDNEIENAKAKLSKKELDFIVLNSLKEEGSGFEYDTNKVTVIGKSGEVKDFELTSKFQAANNILNSVIIKN
jgi:phosphopantothenoylcysteine decarboxylase / phosphopantothenate---cysteine ligase